MSYVLIDGNAIGYSSHNTRVLTHDGEQTQAIFGTLNTLYKLKQEHPDSKFIVLWDTHCQWRYDLHTEYKAKRDDSEEKRESRAQYRIQRPKIQEALSFLGVTQIESEGWEADDLAGFFVRRHSKAAKKTMLVTGDEDWAQLVNALTCFRDPRSNRDILATKMNFFTVFGVKTPAQILTAKALQGDSSDNIPGVGGIGEKTAKPLVNHFGTIGNIFKTFNEGPFEKDDPRLPEGMSRMRNKINAFCKDGKDVLRRNIRLMNLMSDDRDEEMKSTMTIDKGKFDKDAFGIFCGEHGFASIVRNLGRWETRFKE